MRKISINTNKLHTMLEIHQYLSAELKFPQHYGNNLDALYDQLTTLSEPLEIELFCGKDAQSLSDKETGKLIRVLQDASSHRLRVTIIEEEDTDFDSDIEL